MMTEVRGWSRHCDGKSLSAAVAAAALVLALTLSLGGAAVQEAWAEESGAVVSGTGVYGLETDRVYDQFDVTGDGRPDTLLVTSNEDTTKMYVYVNGARAYSASTGLQDAGMFRTIGIKLAVLRNGKSFLSLDPCGGWQTYGNGGLYQWRSGVLKRVVPYSSLIPKVYGRWAGLSALKVSGNKLVLRPCLSTRTIGRALFDFTYVCKSGTLKLASKTIAIKKIYAENSTSAHKKFSAQKKMAVYKSKSCKAKKFTIKKGQKVQFRKLYVSGKTVLFQVKANGKTGWIRGVKRGEPPFKGLLRG